MGSRIRSASISAITCTRAPEDRQHFRIGLDNGRLPFEADKFRSCLEVFDHIQDQIAMWRELYRVMKPGSISVHTFPSAYCLIEPHNFVPFGGLITQYWWYKLWALLGIRHEHQRQQKLNATQTARWNTFRAVENLNNVNDSSHEVVWEELGFQWKWLTQESLDVHPRGIVPWAGRLNRILPLVAWVFRATYSRKVLLYKPESEPV